MAKDITVRRRTLIKATATAAAAEMSLIRPTYAEEPAVKAGSGSVRELLLRRHRMTIAGKEAFVTSVNGSVPGPLLRFREGEDVTLRVVNEMDDTSSIHWHGLLVPYQMDGVPGVSFDGIEARTTFTYRFKLRQSGTYWYHSHSSMQEQTGMYGPIIIDPAQRDPVEANREHVVVLSDWTFENPHRVMSRLKKQADYYNFQRRTVFDFFRDSSQRGFGATVSDRLMWGKMRMNPTDILDVTGATYTFLMNGQSKAQNWTGLFKPGEKVRLRLINAGAMTIFDVRIPGLKMSVVATDGQDVEPVLVDELRIAPAETYDVVVEPRSEAYCLFAESMDRSNYVAGTLAVRPGMRAEVPARRKRPLRTMTDMGMGSHAAMGHGAMGEGSKAASKAKDEHAGHDMGGAAVPQAPPPAVRQAPAKGGHEGHNMSGASGPKAAPPAANPAPQMSRHEGHNMGSAAGSEAAPPAAPASPKSAHEGHNMGSAASSAVPPAAPDHSAHMSASEHAGMQATAQSKPAASPQAKAAVATPWRHGPDTHGPGNQMVATDPISRVGDPGVGFEGSDRKVLVYTDLRRRQRDEDTRPPAREIELHLTGNMERQIWGFNGKKYSEDPTPIPFTLGERIRVTFVNDTMMDHPMHIHGMWMLLENGAGDHLPYKHTILVKAGERLSFLATPDELGHWAFHCHMLYHMDLGMFRVVSVTPGGGKAT